MIGLGNRGIQNKLELASKAKLLYDEAIRNWAASYHDGIGKVTHRFYIPRKLRKDLRRRKISFIENAVSDGLIKYCPCGYFAENVSVTVLRMPGILRSGEIAITIHLVRGKAKK